MSPIQLRIAGYVVTIVAHVSNMLFMMSRFHGDVMRNDFVRHFSEMQFFFFTCWTFTFQTVYSAISLFTDILELNHSDYKPPKILFELRDLFFAVVVWPATIVTTSVFWGMFIYDRNLFYPADIDLAIPNICNHIMHSYITVASLWEAIFRPRTAPKHHGWRYMGVLMVEIGYMFTLIGVYLIKGAWVYPIFGLLTGSVYFYLFFVAVGAWLYVIYRAQWTLNEIVWGPTAKGTGLKGHYASKSNGVGYASGIKAD